MLPTENLSLDTRHLLPATPLSNPDLPQASPLATLFGAGRRRTGKIARKPKPIRDRINQMLLDGFSYGDIIAALGDAGEGLNEDILGRWRSGGYQEWLREQLRVDLLRKKQEFAFDLVCDKDGNKIHQATLQIAASNLIELLLELEPAALRTTLENEPDKYTRLLNAVARLSDGALKCEQHQSRLAQLAKGKTSPEQAGISDASMKQAKEKLNLM